MFFLSIFFMFDTTYNKDVYVMLKFKNNRLVLLKTLRELVSDAIENADINPVFEEDVSKLILDITDKRRVRRLKLIRKELDVFINDLDV
jgi:hypothetical protein